MSSKPSKGYVGPAMEGPIATWYANSARKDTREQEQAARLVAAKAPPGSAILEVAPGPGILAIALARLGGYRVTGLDISQSFVRMARQNAAKAGVPVDFRHGNASDMPLADEQFDFVVCQAAFKNFAEPVIALDEMHRVLKPGGQAVIFDLRGDASPAKINQMVNEMSQNPVTRWMTRWTFKSMLLKRAYTPASFRQLVAQSKFKDCKIETDSVGLTVWLQKRAA